MSVCGHSIKPCVNDADMAGSLSVYSCIFISSCIIRLIFNALQNGVVAAIVSACSARYVMQPK